MTNTTQPNQKILTTINTLKPQDILFSKRLLKYIFIDHKVNLKLSLPEMVIVGVLIKAIPTTSMKATVLKHLSQDNLIQLAIVLDHDERLAFFTYYHDIPVIQLVFEQCSKKCREEILNKVQIEAPYSFAVLMSMDIPDDHKPHLPQDKRFEKYISSKPNTVIQVVHDTQLNMNEVTLLAKHICHIYDKKIIFIIGKYLISYAKALSLSWSRKNHRRSIFIIFHMMDVCCQSVPKLNRSLSSFLLSLCLDFYHLSAEQLLTVFNACPPHIIKRIIYNVIRYESNPNFEKRNKYYKLLETITSCSLLEEGDYVRLMLQQTQQLAYRQVQTKTQGKKDYARKS